MPPVANDFRFGPYVLLFGQVACLEVDFEDDLERANTLFRGGRARRGSPRDGGG